MHPPLESGGRGTISTMGDAGSDLMWLRELVINSMLFPRVRWHVVSGTTGSLWTKSAHPTARRVPAGAAWVLRASPH